MSFDEAHIRGILQDLIDENPVACRAVLGLCGVEFTDQVPTAAVSMAKRPMLRINPAFVKAHCQTEDDVRLLLLHEFLHVVLRHTERFRCMTPLLNVALDVVINTALVRLLGRQRCGLLDRCYQDADGIVRLLAPPAERHRPGFRIRPLDGLSLLDAEGRPTARFHKLHQELYAHDARYTFSDVRELLRDEIGDAEGQLFLGNHDEEGYGEELPMEVMERLEGQVLPALGKNAGPGGRHSSLDMAAERQWRAQVRPILRRLLTPQATGLPRAFRQQAAVLPVLSTSDRRAALRSTWSPFLPMSEHRISGLGPPQGVVVYLDVSTSIHEELPSLLGLLSGYGNWLATPLWAFSTEVFPATFRKGRLQATTTGGTSLECVYAHALERRVKRALVITDGHVGHSEAPPPCRMEALIPHNGEATALEGRGIPVVRLPKW